MPNDTYVALPDGSYVQVPDNASPGDIQALKVKLAALQRPNFASTLANVNRSVQAFQELQGQNNDAGYLSGLKSSLGVGPSSFEQMMEGIKSAAMGGPLVSAAVNTIKNAPANYRAQKQTLQEISPNRPIVDKALATVGVLGPLVGVNPQSQRLRANTGDTSGILGENTIPTAMAAAPLIGEAAGKASEATKNVIGTIARDTTGRVRPTIKGAASTLKLMGGPEIAEAVIPKRPVESLRSEPIFSHTEVNGIPAIKVTDAQGRQGMVKYTMNGDGSASVGAIQLEDGLTHRKIGTDMYIQVAQHAADEGATSLTSDLKGSTSFEAMRAWRSLMKLFPDRIHEFPIGPGRMGYVWDLNGTPPEALQGARNALQATRNAVKPSELEPTIYATEADAKARDQIKMNLKRQAETSGDFHAAQGSTKNPANLQVRMKKKY